MKIDQKMNLVVPIGSEKEIADPADPKKKIRAFVPELYVHSTPIGREVFEKFFLPISKTFASIYTEGLGAVAAPRVAAMMLKRVAEDMGEWDDVPGGRVGVKNGLMAEIVRLSNVVAPGPQGWQVLPLQEAVDQKMISEDDYSEVENALVFFTVASSMHRREGREEALGGLSNLWGARTTSSNCTEFLNSLPTSTATASSGEKAAGSSVPS